MNINFTDVVQHISNYFEEHLPLYTIIEVRRQSYNQEDDYLYMVATKKKDGSFAVHTAWNESTKSLNHGHYDLPDMKACADIMAEYLNTHSTDADEIVTPLECLQELLVKHDDLFENSCDEIVYAIGFVDGLKAQYKNHWNQMTERQINQLFKETIET